MARTLLELVQAAANEIGIPAPSLLFGSQNDQEKQLLALANREGKDFASMANKNGGWQELRTDYTFNTEIASGLTGNLTDGSPIITGISSTAGLEGGSIWGIQADGIDYPCFIVSVDSATQITISKNATATQTSDLVIGKLAYSMPSDFEYFVQKTFWDNQYKWSLIGPISAQEKQILRYGVVASGPRNKFYIRQNKMWLDPMPASSYIIAYDYYSNHWCQSSMGTTQNLWAEDTDTYRLDEDCFIQGMKWRFLRAKGLDYAEELKNYMEDCERVMSRDGGSRDLPLGGADFGQQFLDGANVPEVGFGQ